MIENRQDGVYGAFKALSLQYPGYAESIETRQLDRAAIRFESDEYNRRLNEGIISREVYKDLRQRLVARRSSVNKRPPLDLGLELATMIERVPIFVSLDRPAIIELGKRLRAVVALPDERIIHIGDRPDAMYFIAAGEVTVKGPGFAVVLKEGDFVGEMGLVSDRPRSADVISDGYSHLLALYRKDFRRLLAKRPEVRTEIEAVAARRIAENEGQGGGVVARVSGGALGVTGRAKPATNRAIQAFGARVMSLDRDTVARIARSRPSESFRRKSSRRWPASCRAILAWIEQLNEVDTHNVSRCRRVSDVTLPMREDKVTDGASPRRSWPTRRAAPSISSRPTSMPAASSLSPRSWSRR